MKLAKSKKGFTLIELVMVIVILGILAAVAVPKFADITGDANTAVFNGDIAQVNGGIALSQAQTLVANASAPNGGYPVDLETGDSGSITFSEVIQGGIGDRWSGGGSFTAPGDFGAAATLKTITYTFTTLDTTALYDNFLGTLVPVKAPQFIANAVQFV